MMAVVVGNVLVTKWNGCVPANKQFFAQELAMPISSNFYRRMWLVVKMLVPEFGPITPFTLGPAF